MAIKIDTVIIDSEETSRELIASYLETVDDINIIQQFKDILSAQDYIIENRPPLVIVDITKKTNISLDIISKLTTLVKNIKIIVLSYDTESDIVIKALRAGAREFLVKPLIEKDFVASVQKMKDLILGNINDTTKCKVITTFSNKGGIGKTSIAVNLAMEIANITKEKVALVDLNMQMGDITTFLNLDPSFDTSYVINNLDRIDETFLLTTLEQYNKTSLYVLADPPDIEQAEIITSEDITTLINILRNVFSYIVIDTTSSFDAKTITALDNSDLILLISIINLPSIRNCQRCFDLFKKLGYSKDKIKLIINRYMDADDIKIEDVEEVLDHKVFFKITNNYYTIINSINKGIPICDAAPNSNICKSFKQLGAMLSDNYNYTNKNQKPQNQREQGFKFLNLFHKNKGDN
ncbi:TPA: AAA family ATPase [Candidatus Galligastranaerophilus intestinigallinarum]|nr:AAA family ATPase [Candidatus Galligastranaerophilus intestinigallinarum]